MGAEPAGGAHSVLLSLLFLLVIPVSGQPYGGVSSYLSHLLGPYLSRPSVYGTMSFPLYRDTYNPQSYSPVSSATACINYRCLRFVFPTTPNIPAIPPLPQGGVCANAFTFFCFSDSPAYSSSPMNNYGDYGYQNSYNSIERVCPAYFCSVSLKDATPSTGCDALECAILE